MKTKTTFLIVLGLIFILSACQQKAPKEVSSLSSENPFVFAYTSGVISAADPILIEFTNDMVGTDEVGSEVNDNLLSFTPAIKGVLSWDNPRMLAFIPDEILPSSTTYVAKLHITKVTKQAKGEHGIFDFEFQTKAQNLAVEIDNIRPVNTTDLSQQEIVGTVYTSDVSAPEGIEALLEAVQGNKALKATWDHLDNTTHQFVIQGVDRGNDPSKVLISWNGKNLGANEKGNKTVNIPALGDFKIMEAGAFQEPEQFARLQFSDPLLKRQDLRGLISLSGYEGALRFIIDNNEIKVYPAQRLSGSYTLEINPGIRNVNNARMNEGGTYDLLFEEVKPA